MADRAQLDLFGSAPAPEAPARKGPPPLGPAAPSPAHQRLAAALPPGVRLGTSSWSFPGWQGLVWDRSASEQELARDGLAAYARHPLLRAVGVDRTFYAPLPARALAAYAAQVPEGFRFLVKAHEELTWLRFPDHPRYGARRGADGQRFLDAAWAAEQAVAPFVEGLGVKGGTLLFQFPPQDALRALGPDRFAARVHEFLRRLPPGPLYAIEVRNRELLGPQLAAALRDARAALSYCAWGQLPPLDAQARKVPLAGMPALVARWQLPRGASYEVQREAWAPFSALQQEDPETRRALARLVRTAVEQGKPALVIVNNKAEGSAPLSAFKLAEEIAEGGA